VLGPTIYDFWDSGGLPLVSALTVVQTVITLGALLVMGLVLRQKKEGA
jgi:hypothetical protein